MGQFLTNLANYTSDGLFHAMGGTPQGTPFGFPSHTQWEVAGMRREAHLLTRAPAFAPIGRGAAIGAIAGWYGDDSTAIGGAVIGSAVAWMSQSAKRGVGGFDNNTMGPGWRGKMKMLGAGTFNLGFTGLAVYQGYKENGIDGAKDAMIWDIAVNASLARHGYAVGGSRIYEGLASTKVHKGFLSHAVRGVGAAAGASVGQALGEATGIPGASIAGAFAGAFVGGAPIKFMASHPVMAGGAAVLALTGAAAYGTYQVVKTGRSYQQARRSINTSGDLAAFMTNGAFTMRDRAVQAMQRSHLNARSALGQEGHLYHQSAYRTGRSYGSGY